EGVVMKFFVSVLAGLCLLLQSAAYATDGRLSDDAYTQTGKVKNYGYKTLLSVQGPPADTNVHQSFVKFDLSTLPPGTTSADIDKATLTIFIDKVKSAGAVELHEITSAWD